MYIFIVEQSREGEASRLRQQWARQTKCIPLSSAEEVDVSPGGKVEEGRQEEHILPDSNIGKYMMWRAAITIIRFLAKLITVFFHRAAALLSKPPSLLS